MKVWLHRVSISCAHWIGHPPWRCQCCAAHGQHHKPLLGHMHDKDFHQDYVCTELPYLISWEEIQTYRWTAKHCCYSSASNFYFIQYIIQIINNNFVLRFFYRICVEFHIVSCITVFLARVIPSVIFLKKVPEAVLIQQGGRGNEWHIVSVQHSWRIPLTPSEDGWLS